MLQFSNFDYNLAKRPDFGALTSGQSFGRGAVQRPEESGNIFKPESTPAVSSSNGSMNGGLIDRLNALDSQVITPNNRSDVVGQKLYCFG